MGKEITKRQGIKWVKITHVSRNHYAVAFGWAGNLKAVRVHSGPKGWAHIAADNWLADQ
jgi:hypothetical protein